MYPSITFVKEYENGKIHYTVLSDGRNIGGGIVRTQSDLDYQMQKYSKKGLEVKKIKKGKN
jgi:hypothetical protein